MEFEELLTEYNNGNISINEFKRRITHSYIVNVGKNIAKNLKPSLFLRTCNVINKNILVRSRTFILVEKSRCRV